MTYQAYADHHIRPRTMPACCSNCNDGDGLCVFPYYGMAPHAYERLGNGVTMVARPQEEWPTNFSPDHESDNAGGATQAGVYTHCLECGRPSRYPSELVESDGGEAE